jgi:hypothetical protein
MKTHALDHLYRIQVELGGGLYRGVQEGDPRIKLESVVMFDDPDAPVAERSTMGLRPSELSAEKVRVCIRAQRIAYGRQKSYEEKACTFVLRQFAKKTEAA